MALETQIIDMPLSGGLQEQVDKRLVQPGAFLQFTNLEHVKDGSVTNRRGYGYLPAVGTPVTSVASRGDELVAFAAGVTREEPPRALSYRSTEAGWTRECDAWAIDVRRRAIARDPRGAIAGQRLVVGSRRAFVYLAPLGGELRCLIEELSGTAVDELSVGTVGGGLPVREFRAFQTNGLVCVVYFDGVGTNLRLHTVNLTTLAETDVALTSTSYGTNLVVRVFDAKAIPIAPGRFAVAYSAGASDTTQQIRVETYTTAGALVQTATPGPGAGVPNMGNCSAIQIAFTAAGASCFVVHRSQKSAFTTDDVRVAKMVGFVAAGTFTAAASFYVVVFADLVNAFSTAVAGAHCGVSVCQDVVTDANGCIVAVVDDFRTRARRLDGTGAIAATGGYAVASTMLASELFVFDGRVCALLACFVNNAVGFGPTTNPLVLSLALVSIYPGIDQEGDPTSMIVLDPGHRYVMAFAMVEAFSGILARLYVPTVPARVGSFGAMTPSLNADGSISFAATSIFGAPTTSADFAAGIDETTLSMAGSDRTYAGASNVLVTSGGATAQYDGRDWVELGFAHRPNVYQTTKSVGGGFMADGFYTWAFVYEWTDDEGNVHQSEPAFHAETLSLGGTSQSIAIDVKNIGLTQKTGVVIAMYRTQINGSLFFRVSPRTLDGGATVKANNVGAKLVTFTDGTSDSQLQALGFGFLYTDGGVRATVLAPPSLHAVRHQNRLWSVNAEDPNEIDFTRLLVKQEPPSFGRGFSLRVDGLPEPVTALASLDDKLVIFTKSSIFYIVGAGPDDTGQNGSFSEAYQVSTDCGCESARSVVSTHVGVFFDGPAGIMLLDRGLNVTHAGAPVEDTTATYPTTTRVLLDSAEQRVVWLRQGADADTHTYVVFDYRRGSWYVWPIGSLVPTPQLDHCFWRGEHVICDGQPALRGFGSLPSADPDGSYVPGTLRLPWLNAAAVGGFQRLRKIRLTGTRLDRCTLRARVYNDQDDTTFSQESVFNLGTGSTVLGLPRLRLGVDVKEQLASQHMLELTHEAAAGTNFDQSRLGFELASVTYEIGVKKGPARLAAVNRR